MWGAISQLLGIGDAITKITGQIADAKVQLAKAANDQERIKAEERVKTLEAQRDLQLGEAKFTQLNVYARFGFAMPIIIVLWKILVWDQTLRLGTTPDLGDKMWNLIYMVAGFYFVQSITQLIKR
jgi:hypothetical protein